MEGDANDMSMPLFVKEIKQVSSDAFAITWTDGLKQRFKLNVLQQHCPCAGCRDSATGKKLVFSSSDPGDVKAVFIRSVGRYALRIQFTSGCSAGIYGFDQLRQLGESVL